MHILVLGSGGREHALIRALKRSKKVKRLSCAPGNPGISFDAASFLTDPVDPRGVVELSNRIKPDLVVIGPELPLANGVSDTLRQMGFLVFGPSQNAARLETSKAFSKNFMIRHEIPTARSLICTSKEEMLKVQSQFKAPYVVKADGLAAGKGVRICVTPEEYVQCAEDFFDKKLLGSAAQKVLIEDYILGEELSLMVLVADGKYSILPVSQDHKRLFDKNEGPNTGGMGAFAPVKKWSKILTSLEEKIIKPTIAGLVKDKLDYRGVLYIGVIHTKTEAFVLEYNVRFGDPEAQVLLPLLDGDWADVFKQIAQGTVPKLKWKKDFAVAVVIASPGYPENPRKNIKIILEKNLMRGEEKKYLLHASTVSHHGLYANGGRVLNAVAIDKTLAGARKKAYEIIKGVEFEGMQYRSDIALEVKNGRR
jgi:phosphoribosylamine--glycine ligase